MNLREYLEKLPRGGAASLAEKLSISPSFLSQIAARTCAVSPERCVEIELATNGEVTRKDLRPDDWERIWPELSEKEGV